MTFKIDYVDGEVLAWQITPDGARVETDPDYTPTIYVAGESTAALAEPREHLDGHPRVAATSFATGRTRLRDDPETVLRVDVTDIEAATDVAHEIRGWGDPGEYELYNVDFTREFRYCLENDVTPVPDDDVAPTVCELTLPPKARNDGDVAPLRIDGRRAVDDTGGDPAAGDTCADEARASDTCAGDICAGDAPGRERAVVEAVADHLAAVDPDVLVLSSADLVPLLYERALAAGFEGFELGRRPGYQQLARESTFESYGRVGHSPARYTVPGRAIVDTSNSFFWSQTNLDGLLDLAARSKKPLQETAWASIGNVFTAIQIDEAFDHGRADGPDERDGRAAATGAGAHPILVPWNSWRHEQFKPMTTLHESDRGGFIFSPVVGLHEDVHELDFASLYPNIMVEWNISPDTIRCACHPDREDVPGLGYSICPADDRGFLHEVLKPLVDDRAEYKAEIEATDDADRAAELRGRSSALKWILVSCFGYQGFSNAKFGRIECHEAINAVARELLLDTKELLEDDGWRVLHGIVDSLWVQAIPGESRTPLDELAPAIGDAIGVPLEYEAHYDWIAFAPRRDSDEGALNRYVAKRKGADPADDGAFKRRGIELRQRSTPPFVEDCQRELLRLLDEHREPAPVCDRLQLQLRRLRSGDVDPSALVIRRRVSQEREAYTQYTRNVAALERAAVHEFDVAPGEDVEYVVVDDEKESAARVALAFEEPDRYDASFYADRLIRAAESLLSPLGWDRARIRRYLDDTRETRITAY